ncbi:unnamed protein product [Cuscuta campestris]|uniref:Uncharacterized protein n=1 Tax=Cuscuta campestris TaxID=132261 RepID=A0A484MFV2_9ASTE|nr:unnamed protein product [Cuscuta campestris]VFQ87881.1 unnamed protein product [Cuscuta campestris]
MSQWQGQVAERIQTLSQRAGSSGSTSALIKWLGGKILDHQTFGLVEKPSGSNKHRDFVLTKSIKVGSSKPVQESSGGYDAKLTEMINSVIVD